jgi:hypothetical protein
LAGETMTKANRRPIIIVSDLFMPHSPRIQSGLL